MDTFGGMKEKRGGPDARQRRGDFLSNQTAFSHSGHDDSALAGDDEFDRPDEILPKAPGQPAQRIGFNLERLDTASDEVQ